MMSSYLDRTNGRVHLAKILGAGGKKQTDLPTLPQYVHPNGRPFLCWTSVLGRCMYRECRFHQQEGHPNPKDISNDFADKVVEGVIAICGSRSREQPNKLFGDTKRILSLFYTNLYLEFV
jgi:hypothetical protein